MTDMSLAAGVTTYSSTVQDELVARNHHLLETVKMVLATGQNLKRGALVGKVTADNSGTAVAGSSNTGTASVGTVTVGSTAVDGAYVVTVTAAKNGETAATFLVTAPDGSTATGSMGSVFTGFGLSFTITDGVAGEGTAAAIVGDKWTITVTAPNGELKQSSSGASDGTQTPVGILAHDANATSGDREVMVYVRGDFNQDKVGFGTGQTPDSVRAALADIGIFLHKRNGAPASNATQPAL